MLFCIYTCISIGHIDSGLCVYPLSEFCLCVMSTTQYCYGCERKCRSALWYGPDGFQFCGNSYVNMHRRGYLVRHPTWPVYEENIHRTDETGARICAAVYRKDALALREGAVFLSRSMLEPVTRMLVSLLASTFYFAWPAHAFIHRIIALQSKMPGKATLIRIGREVFEQFRAYRVVQGQLVVASPARGISVTKNPSERQCGRIRFNAILEDLPDIIRMLKRIHEYFRGRRDVSLAAMLEIFGDSGVYTSRVIYKNVRCARILAEAAGKPLSDCEEDFKVFQRMSAHMRSTLTYRGLVDFKTAMKFVVGMRAATGLPQYGLNDLIIYTCLMGGMEFED